MNVTGGEGRYMISRKTRQPEKVVRPEEAIPDPARRAGDASPGNGRRRQPTRPGGMGQGGAARLRLEEVTASRNSVSF